MKFIAECKKCDCQRPISKRSMLLVLTLILEPSLDMHTWLRMRQAEIGIAVRRVVQYYATTEQHRFPFSRKVQHPLAKYAFNMQHNVPEIYSR